MVRLFYIVFIAFRNNINRAFLRFSEDLGKVLTDNPQAEQLYATNKQNNTNRGRPARYGVAEQQRADKHHKQRHRCHECEKYSAPRR